MDFKQKYKFEKLNENKIWEDKCNICCMIKCKVFGDFERQCHCQNFKDIECKRCKHKNLCF